MVENISPSEESKFQEALHFLALIAPGDEQFTFQTFDDVVRDGRKRKRPALVKIFHGPLRHHWADLQALNSAGAGVYVTVNRTDLRGRETTNVVGVRDLFADLDGAPLEPVVQAIKPTVVVETSAGKFHVYYRVRDLPLEEFSVLQKKLAARFGGDPKVVDLPRVMRLPGFRHMKDPELPFWVHVISEAADLEYPPQQIREIFEDREARPPPEGQDDEVATLCSAALEALDDWVPLWFPQARREGTGAWRVTAEELGREGDLEEELSLHPEGIKDFGLADQDGETREGRRTPIEVLMEYGAKLEFQAAVAWLSEKIGFRGIPLEDYWHYAPDNGFVDAVTAKRWVRAGIVSRFTKRGAAWIERHQSIEDLVWAPGEGLIVKDKVLRDGGWKPRMGTRSLNIYQPSGIRMGDPGRALPWVDHIRRIFPDDADCILDFFAWTVQRPADKINHALVLYGPPGIGKDTILAGLRRVVGSQNWRDIAPKDLFGTFNPHMRSKVLAISELENLGDKNKYQFHEAAKTVIASPPETVKINDKHALEYYVLNVCSVIMTMNGAEGSLYLKRDDRRHYVARSFSQPEDFNRFYFPTLWTSYRNGGFEGIAAWLQARNLADFDPNDMPLKTDAFWRIVGSSRPSESVEIEGILGELGNPDAFTLQMIIEKADAPFQIWLENPGHRQFINHRIEDVGYSRADNRTAKTGMWKIRGRYQVVYARTKMGAEAREAAATGLVSRLNAGPAAVT